MFCFQTKETHQKLESCQPSAVSSANQDQDSSSSITAAAPSSDNSTDRATHAQHSLAPVEKASAAQQTVATASGVGSGGQSQSSFSAAPSATVSLPVTSLVTSSGKSPAVVVERVPPASIALSPAWDALSSTHQPQPVPYDLEDVERCELLSITKLNTWDYPIFDLASQAQTTVLSQVSIIANKVVGSTMHLAQKLHRTMIENK